MEIQKLFELGDVISWRSKNKIVADIPMPSYLIRGEDGCERPIWTLDKMHEWLRNSSRL